MTTSHRTRRGMAAGLIACAVLSTGCGLRGARTPLDVIDPSLYTSGTVYTYQPLNPTTIWVRDPEACELMDGDTAADITSLEFRNALLRDLDTETLRISLARLGANASANAFVVGSTIKGESYVLIVDYIKYFTSTKRVTAIAYNVTQADGTTKSTTFSGNVPLYSGIGMRIRAEFVALEGGVSISGLPALAIAAQANAINGRLTVQTLGITGPEITGLMPIISDISVSSIQSAVQAVAAIKAKLYDDTTIVYPKIVGFESPTINPDLTARLSEHLYGLQEFVVPRVSPSPTRAGERIVWVGWAASENAGCQPPARAAGADREP